MELKDFIKIPGTKVNWYSVLWVLYCFGSIIPGFLLWIMTLGGFRYFHLSGKICDYLINKEMGN